MGGLLLGFALGAMAFTEQGREIGNQMGAAALSHIKKVMDNATEPSEQSPGTSGDHRITG